MIAYEIVWDDGESAVVCYSCLAQVMIELGVMPDSTHVAVTGYRNPADVEETECGGCGGRLF